MSAALAAITNSGAISIRIKRTTHPSQIPLSTTHAGNRIHEHNALRFSEKFGKVTHWFVMLTNVAAAVNFKRA